MFTQSYKKVSLFGQNRGHSAFISNRKQLKDIQARLSSSSHDYGALLQNSRLSASVLKSTSRYVGMTFEV